MAVEPARRILGTPLVRRKDEPGFLPRRPQKQQKKSAEQGTGKIDIKV